MVDYKKIKYDQKNITSIKNLRDSSQRENSLHDLINSLQEFLAEKHENLVGDIILGRRKKEKLEDVIKDFLDKQEEVPKGFLKDKLVGSLVNDIVGWGVLQPLIDDLQVTNIFTNEKLEVIKRVHGEDIKTNIKFENEEELETFIRSIMIRTGEKIGRNNCIEDGFDNIYKVRINAGISGSSLKREVVRMPYLALRTYRVFDFEREFFIENETMSTEIADFLENETLDANIIVVGEPDAGKSTFLEYYYVMKNRKDPMRRIIRIEEQAELGFQAENSVSFFERTADREDDTRKRYDMAEFAKIATRLAGKDVVIGEVRGAEAWYLLRLMNMGYKAACSTHGDGDESAIHNLAFLMNLEVTNVRYELLVQRICKTIDFVIYISRKKVVNITEITGYDPETNAPMMNRIFELQVDENGKMNWKKNDVSEEFKKSRTLIELLNKRRV